MKEAIRNLRQKNKELEEQNEELHRNGVMHKMLNTDVQSNVGTEKFDEAEVSTDDVLKFDFGTQTESRERENVCLKEEPEFKKKLEVANREIEELKERNEVLEEYYEENCRKPNETVALKKENEKLVDEVEILRAQIELMKKEKNEIKKSENVVEREGSAQVLQGDDDSDHTCFTQICDDDTPVNTQER